jgi:hypothetical protein
MADDTPEEAIERGMEAYFAGDSIKELLEGVDVEALADGAAFDEAVEYERLGKVLGALLGRAAAKGASSSGLLGRVVKESAGSEVGGRVGEAAAVALVENIDIDALAEQVRTITDGEQLDRLGEGIGDSIAGSGAAFGAAESADTEWTEIDVEDPGEDS